MDSQEPLASDSINATDENTSPESENWLHKTWEQLVRLGLHDTARRVVAMISTMLFMVLAILFMNRFFCQSQRAKAIRAWQQSVIAG